MSASSAWPARLVLALLLCVLCTTSGLLWWQMEHEQREHLDERLAVQAQTLARQLENALQLEVTGLGRIARLWNSLGGLPRDAWENEVNHALSSFPAYQSIQWVDADRHMRWLLPLTGNEAVADFRLPQDHPNYPLTLQARDSGEQRFSNSFELAQGGRGVILYTPLYRTHNGARGFDGFLQGVFRIAPLMDELLSQLDRDAFNLELLEGDHAVYRHGRIDDESERSRQVQLHLLNNQSFSLRLSPTPRLLAQLDTPLPGVVLGASLTISLLLVAALALALENNQRARALQAVNQRLNQEAMRRQETERRLRENRERLQLVIDLTDSCHDGLFIFDTEQRNLLHMNQATYASLGYRAEQFSQLLRDDPEKLLPGFHGWLEQARQAQHDNLSRIFQRELIRRDGSRQPAEINTQLVQLREREYLIAVSRNNSERLQLEAQLQRLSQQDGLTGLYNRRYFDQQLLAEWRRVRRLAAPLALLMLDIDHFKAYNDALGHLAGDDALRMVSEVLQNSLQREGDVACRYGGEEFAIILATTTLEGALHVAARVHAGLASQAIVHPASPQGRLTLSIGVSVAEADSELQPGELVAHSDHALYQAKREGRNRTCIHPASAEQGQAH